MKPSLVAPLILSLFAPPTASSPLGTSVQPPRRDTWAPATSLPRLAIYYQTTHSPDTGYPISLFPLITEKNISLTHVYISSLHINLGGVVHLNDHLPSDARFATLWREAEVLRKSGVRVMAMVGGAAPGSFTNETLDAPEDEPAAFEHYYGQLRDVLRLYSLQGLDLDVEQPMSAPGIVRLVRRLRADFGPDFSVTMAPVASALTGGANLSGFSYPAVDAALGSEVEYYNAQFYNGFGDMSTTAAYNGVVSDGAFDPVRIVAGQLTSPDNGVQFVPFATLRWTMAELLAKYGRIGGVMGWEYFNGKPGGQSEPWEWARQMTAILRPDRPAQLRVSRADADGLDAAWTTSVAAVGPGVAEMGGTPTVAAVGRPAVDYQALVNV